MEYLSAIREVVLIVAGLVGIGVAVAGLSEWRKQLVGKTEYETALVFLRAAFRLRDAIAWVRNPMMTAGEMVAATQEASTDPTPPSSTDDSLTPSVSAAYEVRWREVSSAVSELDAARVEAEIAWGNRARELATNLRKHVGKLNWALTHYLAERRKPSRHSDSKRTEEIHDIVFWQGTETDPFTVKVSDAVQEIEDFVRPKMKA